MEEYDPSSIRMLVSGAAPLTRDLVDAVRNKLKVKVKQAYGLSETSPATHIQVRYIFSFFSRPRNAMSMQEQLL